MDAYTAAENLLSFALRGGLIGREDVPYARNRLYARLELAPRQTDDPYALPDENRETATEYLRALCAYAAEEGLIKREPPVYAELYSAELMGLLTARPSDIAKHFAHMEEERGIEAATEWFYRLCKKNDYIRVDEIARNRIFEEDSSVGKLTITINLTKPEKDPKMIELERNTPATGYPRCMLCVENPGFAGRVNFPARQNHRMIPLTLNGNPWHFQYSPYSYYNEHCIVLNDSHTPMKIERGAFVRMFDFVERFPHYFIGSNADLPVVGGSILSHDHFQGGRYVFPMTRAGLAARLVMPDGMEAGIVDWPLSALRMVSGDREALTGWAVKILEAWRAYSDEDMGILAETAEPHNTITPILRRDGGWYIFDLVLRNNRRTREHPDGIYHPHAELHHIKKEGIGLIEVMGLFILPGRLLTELDGVREALSDAADPFGAPDWGEGGILYKHLDWAKDIRNRRGVLPDQDAERVIREELAEKCAQVLTHCGVYPRTDRGLAGFLRFLATLGISRA